MQFISCADGVRANKDIVIIYHKFCTDGFGAAYVAWKKFKDTAIYIPQDRTDTGLPVDLIQGKEVYILDYSFSLSEMLHYQSIAKSFTVIDHHSSAEDSITQLSSHIFDTKYSGAFLAWNYFHPNTEAPKLIQYISDADTWAHILPDWEEIESFIYSDLEYHFTFEHFERLENTLASHEGYLKAKEIGALLLSKNNQKINHYSEHAELITFEGYQIYAANAPYTVKSKLGYELAKKTNSFALIYYYEKGYWKCSLRSVNDFDVSQIAQKYGGGGHKNSAAFLLKTLFPLSLAEKN